MSLHFLPGYPIGLGYNIQPLLFSLKVLYKTYFPPQFESTFKVVQWNENWLLLLLVHSKCGGNMICILG